MKAHVSSAIDVALCLGEIAGKQHIILSLSRLQWLLFLAQQQFAEETGGEMLMPSVFVLRRSRLMEANVMRCFTGDLHIVASRMGQAEVIPVVRSFLDALWQSFAAISDQQIQRMLLANAAYQRLMRQPDESVVSFVQICQITDLGRTATKPSVQRLAVKSGLDRSTSTLQPQTLQVLPDGRTISAWRPKVSQAEKHFRIATVKRK